MAGNVAFMFLFSGNYSRLAGRANEVFQNDVALHYLDAGGLLSAGTYDMGRRILR